MCVLQQIRQPVEATVYINDSTRRGYAFLSFFHSFINQVEYFLQDQ